MGEMLLVSKNSKVSTFKHEPKMAERRVGSQELKVEGRLFPLSIGQLLEVESQRSP